MHPSPSPRRAPRRAPRRGDRRLLVPAATVAVALLVAACGGDGDRSGVDATSSDESVTAITDTTDTTEEAPVTSLAPPTTVEVPPTTAAPSTSTVATAVFPGTSEWAQWLVVRRVTTDDGYWGQTPEKPVIEVVAYWMRCADETCAAPEFEARRLSEFESNGNTQTSKVDAGIMSWAEATTVACLSTATGQVDGPAESNVVASFGLAATEAGAVWQGVYDERITTVASPACVEENVGYTADMWLFDPANVARSDQAIGTWYGDIGDFYGVERAVRACEPTEGCELLLRQAIDDPNNPAGGTRMFVDFPLSRGADGVWYGVAEYDESCLSDVDGTYLAEQGYLTRHELWLTVYDLGEASTQRLVAEVDERRTGSAHPSLAPDVAAACGPFERTIRFGGVLIDTPTITDWTKPAEVREPIPAG